MTRNLTLLAVAAFAATFNAQAQVGSYGGTARMQAMIDALSRGDTSAFTASEQKALRSGMTSATAAMERSAQQQLAGPIAGTDANAFQQLAREAFIASLPPRDKARGVWALNGDQLAHESYGRFYYFVSRTMPMSMLRAYALDAFYTGGTLVMKGVRKGDTLAEYLENAFFEFNSMEGMHLAGVELNPNMFDMFDVDVVPTVVWTNRIGLDDVGSGCPSLPADSPLEYVALKDHRNQTIEVRKPTCAQVPASSYYKISGALAMPYVVERFAEAGMPAHAVANAQSQLAARSGAVITTDQPALGNAQAPLSEDFTLDVLPAGVFKRWHTQLAKPELKVHKSPYGPVFSTDGEEDPEYRREVESRVSRGLGLSQ